MKILNDFSTSVHRALSEIDKNYEIYNGLVICGTHNPHNVDEMIEEIRIARKNNTPALLICFGHQLGAIEYARNVLGIKDATSEEFGKGTFVVRKRKQLKVGLHEGESWWSNYDVAIDWVIPSNFTSVPFHPEYGSWKGRPHPLLVRFINMCKKQNKGTRGHGQKEKTMQQVKWQCKYAPSLGALEGTPQEVWGTVEYTNPEEPCVWFGLYGLPDFYSIWSHKGRRAILWAGSDLTHLTNGYWLEDGGGIRLDPYPITEWINKYCENYVENSTEQTKLRELGIESTMVPSFMGNVDDIEVSYVWSARPKVYSSVSGDNFEMYGWDVIERIADKCNVDFYLYGSNNWKTKHPNVHIQGRVPKERMNSEIALMQCGLRMNDFDGFSEILAKSILMGQHPISRLPYPMVDSYENDDELVQLLNDLVNKTKVNTAKDFYLQIINKYPWNDKDN